MKKVPIDKKFLNKILFIVVSGALVIYGSIILFGFVRYMFVGNRENINTTETRKFISSTMKSDSNIDKGKIFRQNGALQFDYTVKNEPTKDELTAIFDSSYNFMINYYKLKDSVIKSYGAVCFNIHYKADNYIYEGRNFVYDKRDKEAGYTKTYNTWTLTKNNVNIYSFTKDYLLCEE
ncbi:hypothetical protein [Clostridium folliculivorans]|uniref:Uncharacterized protein n=1 Tax=Clostridium folliculivorans TaxID=2886038 RepID=A0A9W6DBM1_9CLOT|nr:hypothetical protein [Clostridium folliculivorans]GKU26580.1 hypothetical protein CFOLD11_34070 [Clostridium folliculivorans]GKU28988.1 hypothetical protein CFB3_10940 [Clostridium folliculivorans]